MTTAGLRTPAELLQHLPQHVESAAGFAEAVEALRQRGRATFDGVWGSSCALLTSALLSHATAPLLVVCCRPDDAEALRDDGALFASQPFELFPAWEGERPEQILLDEVFGERLRLLKQLQQPPRQARAIVASIQALLQPVPSRDELGQHTRILRRGERVDIASLLRWLTTLGFHATSAVELPGEYSHRGGILDVFAADWDQPVRIELFDDEIESLRRFDVASQRSLEQLAEVEITMLEPPRSADCHLASYLPADAWILVVEAERVEAAGRQFLERLENPASMHDVPAVMRSWQSCGLATASAVAAGELGAVCRLGVESVERLSGDASRVKDELDQLGQDQDVVVVSSRDAEIARLRELFQTTGVASTNRLHFVVGQLRAGFRLVAQRTVVISANELFHRGDIRRLPRRRLGKAIDSFVDLREGDLVVHLAHGIGRYRGIELLDKQGHVEEHLKLEFAEGAKLYVPTSKIDLVQKYVGGTKSRPTLAKLGGATWLRQKQAAEAAVLDMAVEMLQLQAERLGRPGIAFGPDGEWQREFDASFPYEETADQLAAITAIKSDMEAVKPMDRLLCGDVGFGKTEVAMRAAFKAVDNGYQVAVLVPTTILAEQHYHTFLERFAEFPFDIARLSRFCSPQEEREILTKLAAGQVDIVIGTHRLSSRDVHFHNLGLVIIDEEQRFGVEVKERLKTLRSTVDILTMTATPIPRTLHMSLVGVRDISNLETAPEERVPVETRLSRFNPELIRHAVLRELSRGGQIFFVHNRVEDIEVVARKLRQCVPEARIDIAHGQMPEDQLERVMVDFVSHRFDLLLATTIVESGLDIPNANTIFIDEADRYGLADLHQLRGRVGRYKHRAYCYLLIDPHKHLTPNAAKRLRAIEEYSEMGAGFALAMRDLEIRGTGNLLGVQQSGHIAAVGYEFYCQLLENAVRQLKQLPRKLAIDVDIDLPGEAFIPDEYVPDLRMKIDLYRRVRRVEHARDLGELRQEFVDRFGPIPDPVDRLLQLVELRLDATIWQISAIHIEDRDLVFDYTDRRRVEQLSKRTQGRLKVVDDRRAYCRLKHDRPSAAMWLAAAKSVLQP
ncbi:MAG: transcription-repair coupling factor [Pirellulaceae bacterium]